MPLFSIDGALQLLHDPEYVKVVGVDGCSTNDSSAFDEFLVSYSPPAENQLLIICKESSIKSGVPARVLIKARDWVLVECDDRGFQNLVEEFRTRVNG